jgi:autoinducer 2 (AI-2) kinase
VVPFVSSALLGFDLGGGSGRALVLEPDTGRCTVARCGWPRSRAEELYLDSWFELLCDAALRAQERAGRPEILGIAAAGMRFSTVMIDAAGEIVMASPNRDARAVGQAIAAAAASGERLQRLTGHWPSTVLAAARMRWLVESEPALAERVVHVLTFDQWLAWRLCGEVAADPSQAGGTGLYDPSSGEYSSEAAAQWDVSLSALPPIRPSGERLGGLTAGAAGALELPPRTPVAVGGGDSQVAALAVGAVHAGATAAISGTTMPIQRVKADPLGDPAGALWLEPHVVDGAWMVESNAGPTGDALAWLGRVLHPDAPVPAASLLAAAGRAPVGSQGLTSHFGAQVMNARAMEIPVGELTLSHMLLDEDKAGDAVARAFVEGLAYAVRANIVSIDACETVSDGRLRLAGGMSRSGTWARILASVNALPVAVPDEPESTALGAALCAGVGAGAWGDLKVAADTVVQLNWVEPDTADSEFYHAGFERWQALREARAPAAGVAQGQAIQALLSGAAGAVARSGDRRPRILVTADLHADALDRLRAIGEVDYQSYRDVGRLLSGSALVEALQGYALFVTEIDLVDGASLLELPQLRAIGVCRGTAVNVDAVACERVGIPVMHTPGRNADAVADLAVAFILSLARKLPEAITFLRDPAIEAGDLGSMGRAFGTLRGRELWGKTVGLIGLGAVGRQVARRLRRFGARILVHDPFIDSDAVALALAEPASLESLLAESDFVSLHAAVTDASRGLIGREALAQMKTGACLVNTARAALVDEAELAEALGSGKLGGAALDVFSVEPPGADHPLLRAPNVIATPHLGGNTFEVGAHQGDIIASELERLLSGERPHHLIRPDALAAFSLDGARAAADKETVRFLRARPQPTVSDLKTNEKKESKPRSSEAVAAATLAEDTASAVRTVLEAFVADFATDGGLRHAAKDRDVTLHFTLTDAALCFYLRLRDGEAAAGLEEPESEAEVELKMTAQVLDGMLGGTLNAMQAATTGEISFSGDAGKAMTIQELQADLERVYVGARARIGAPLFDG